MNIDNTFGAIGFVSRILPAVYPISVIKADPATGEPIRNRKGFCEECGPSKPHSFLLWFLLNCIDPVLFCQFYIFR